MMKSGIMDLNVSLDERHTSSYIQIFPKNLKIRGKRVESGSDKMRGPQLATSSHKSHSPFTEDAHSYLPWVLQSRPSANYRPPSHSFGQSEIRHGMFSRRPTLLSGSHTSSILFRTDTAWRWGHASRVSRAMIALDFGSSSRLSTVHSTPPYLGYLGFIFLGV